MAAATPILIFHKRRCGCLEPGSWLLTPAKAAVCASLLPSVGWRALPIFGSLLWG